MFLSFFQRYFALVPQYALVVCVYFNVNIFVPPRALWTVHLCGCFLRINRPLWSSVYGLGSGYSKMVGTQKGKKKCGFRYRVQRNREKKWKTGFFKKNSSFQSKSKKQISKANLKSKSQKRIWKANPSKNSLKRKSLENKPPIKKDTHSHLTSVFFFILAFSRINWSSFQK